MQLGLGSKVLSVANSGESYHPDFPVPAMRQIPEQVNFQSLLFRASGGEISASPARRGYPVAIYGVSDCQVDASDFIRCKLEMHNRATIANFNKELGIVHYNRRRKDPKSMISEFAKHIATAADKTLIKKATSQAPIVEKWARYLGEHKDRLDAFSRLNKLLSRVPEQERLAVAEQFVRKNTSSECDAKSLAECLVKLIDDSGCKTLGDADAFLNESGSSISYRIQEDLAELVVKHFFRNSSKLGLTFFVEHGASIIFGWDNGGRKLDIDAIQEKPWKEGEGRRFGDMYEPITYSEVRSILRNPKLFANKVSKVSFERKGEKVLVLDGSKYYYSGVVELAGSPQSNEWVAIPMEMDFVNPGKSPEIYSFGDVLQTPGVLGKLVRAKHEGYGNPWLTTELLEGHIEAATAFIEEMKVAYKERDIDQSRFVELLQGKAKNYSCSALEEMLLNSPASEIKAFIGEIGKAFKEEIINYDQLKKLTAVNFSRCYRAEGGDAFLQGMKAACDEKLIDKVQLAQLLAENFASVAERGYSAKGPLITLMRHMRVACDEGIINEPQFASYQTQFAKGMAKGLTELPFYYGDIAVIENFIREMKGYCREGLLNSVLLSETLAAKNSYGSRGVYYALEAGKTNTVKAYISEIKAAHAEGYISDEQFASLIVAKTPHGEPAWSLALLKGHTDTANACIQEVGPLFSKGIVSRSALDVPSVPKEKVPASLIEAIASFAPPASGSIASHPVESRPQYLVYADSSR
ncbi:hypothetical protein [Burkholderia pyrrocinia]